MKIIFLSFYGSILNKGYSFILGCYECYNTVTNCIKESKCFVGKRFFIKFANEM